MGEKPRVINDELEAILGRKIVRREQEYVEYWQGLGISNDIILHITKYCVQRDKKNFAYINAVMGSVEDNEVNTIQEVEKKYLIAPDDEKGVSNNQSIISIRISCNNTEEKIKSLERLQEVFVLEKVNSTIDKENSQLIHTYIEASFKWR